MVLKFIRAYFKITSIVAPKSAGRTGFKLFQKVRIKKIRDRENNFYDRAEKFTVPYDKEDIDCYELGSPKGKLVILVHGWESNAGSMSQLAFKFTELGYRVVAFNLPGHAFYSSSSTNLLECFTAMKKVLNHLNPKEPFSIVSHSLGSAVVANTLSRTNYRIDRLVFLSSPNKVNEIFMEFKEIVAMNDKAYKEMLKVTDRLLNASIDTLDVDTNLKKAKYNELLIMHDKNDRILSYNNSKTIEQLTPNSRLITLENVGHYKMLWDSDVINRTVSFIEKQQ
jgi:pimeloyl-ACP methyl ester carboxylesterase